MNKEIIIENNTTHKGKSHKRVFACQVFETENKRTYVLDETKRELGLKRFSLEEGCRVIDNGITYPIYKIFFSPVPQQTFIIVHPESHL